MDATSPTTIMASALAATITPAREGPTESRGPGVQVHRRPERRRAWRIRRRRTSAAIVSTSITAIAIAYARASHVTRPPLARIDQDHGGDRHVDGTGRSAEPRVKRGEPARQRAVGG